MARFEKGIWFIIMPALVMALVFAVSLNATVDSLANGETFDFTVTIRTIPENTGMVIFDGNSYSDYADVFNLGAKEYQIEANPDTGSGYVFFQWTCEGGINVPNPNLASTICVVSGNGTLTMVQKPGADLRIDKDGPDDPVTNGDEIRYHIDLYNDGPSAATGVKVVDTLPPGVTFLSALPGTGIYNGGTYTWDIGNMAPYALEEFSLSVKVDQQTPPGTLTNTANVTSSTYDPIQANDTFSWAVRLTGRPPVGVGGEVKGVDKLTLGISWFILAIVLTAGGAALALRLRRVR